MEEKERYEWNSRFDEAIKDNQTGDIVNAVEVLNKQDKRIKELEEENNFLEKRNEELIIDRRDICLERNDIFEEKQQLKQQLHDLPKKIVEEIRDVAGDYWEECGNVPDLNTLTMEDFDEILDTILEKFGGEDE